MSVQKHRIDEGAAGQRLDNYLFSRVKGVPKSRIYRAIRGGEVRINGKRVKAHTRLAEGDELRLPPLRQGEAPDPGIPSARLKLLLDARIMVETPSLMVLNKPAGIPVHGGSSDSLGVIEALRQMRPNARFLELVHRLDKATSGCLLIAKKRSALLHYQNLFREQKMTKRYWLLVKGKWSKKTLRCDLPLHKNVLAGGGRIVRVDHELGKRARTVFRPIQVFSGCSLLEANLHTGRTHQIRVHASALGHPIAGDDKYGDKAFNQAMRQQGVSRLFLHCVEMSCSKGENCFGVCSRLDQNLANALNML